MKNKFINRPTCAIVLSILGFVFILTAFITARTLYPISYVVSSAQEARTYTAEIEWSVGSFYLAFMLVGALILCIKFSKCTLKHYKLDPTNKLLMANMVIEALAIIITVVAAFGIFMFKKEGVLLEDVDTYELISNLYKPYTILSTMALGLSFFGSVTNLVVLAKE